MKKFIALITVIVTCVTCFALPAFAKANPDFTICIDFIQTRKDPCLDKDNFLENPEVENFDKNVATAGGKYTLKNSKAKYLFFEGWISTDYEYADEDTSIGTRVDGGEIVWTSEWDINLNPGNTYHDYALRTFVNIPICKGSHHVEVLAKIYGEAEPMLIFDFDYESDFGDEIVITPVPEPTEVPATPEPTAIPATEAPTDVPATEVPTTEAPKATESVQPTEAPAQDDSGKINPAVIIAIAAAVVVIGVVIFLVTKKKK